MRQKIWSWNFLRKLTTGWTELFRSSCTRNYFHLEFVSLFLHLYLLFTRNLWGRWYKSNKISGLSFQKSLIFESTSILDNNSVAPCQQRVNAAAIVMQELLDYHKYASHFNILKSFQELLWAAFITWNISWLAMQ